VAKSFEQGCAELEALVGDGELVGTFLVDGGGRTVPLETGFWRNHAGRNGRVGIRAYNDGGPHAAQNSLEASYEDSLRDVAETVLKTGPQGGMERHVERVDAGFKGRAPRRTGSYRDSTGRVVTDDGVPVYERFGEHYGEEPRP
jgi:accessory colonization factor AcfC